MIQFNKPETLNGEQLLTELNAVKIKIDGFPFIDGNGSLWLDIQDKDKTKTQEVIDNHIAIDSNQAKAAQRQALLNKLGITAEEAQLLLGGN